MLKIQQNGMEWDQVTVTYAYARRNISIPQKND